LLYGDLSDKEMNDLYNHPKVKCMISFTKGEGFGRPLLEFSIIGKPIIASGWGGHTDFLSPEYSLLLGGKLNKIHSSAVVPGMLIEDSQWFQPDDADVGSFLTKVFSKDYDNLKVKAKRLAFRNKSNFTLDKMTKKLEEIFTKHIKNIPKLITLDLPKLTKIE
jgi:glycosyltransferase involved in cell wall biosynthesis